MSIAKRRIGLDWDNSVIRGVVVGPENGELALIDSQEWSDRSSALRQIGKWASRWDAPVRLNLNNGMGIAIRVPLESSGGPVDAYLPTEASQWSSHRLAAGDYSFTLALFKDRFNSLIEDLKQAGLWLQDVSASPCSLYRALTATRAVDTRHGIAVRYAPNPRDRVYLWLENERLIEARSCLVGKPSHENLEVLLHAWRTAYPDHELNHVVWLQGGDWDRVKPQAGSTALRLCSEFAAGGHRFPIKLLGAFGAAINEPSACFIPESLRAVNWPLSDKTYKRLVMSVASVTLLTSFIALGLWRDSNRQQTAMHSLRQEIRQQAQRLQLQLPNGWDAGADRLGSLIEQYHAHAAASAAKQENDYFAILSLLSRSIPASIQVRLDDFRWQPKSAFISGSAGSFGELEELQKVILGLFPDRVVQLRDSVTLADGSVRFTISIEVKG